MNNLYTTQTENTEDSLRRSVPPFEKHLNDTTFESLDDYWENRLKIDYNLEGVGYAGLGKQYNRWLYRVRRLGFLRKIKSLNLDMAETDVLDVGSGTGFYIELWQKLGVNSVSGSDITQIAIEGLQKIYPTSSFYRFDIGGNTVPNLDRQFQVISAIDVMYHIVDDVRYENAIQNVRCLLAQDGLFIFSDNFIHGSPKRGKHQVSRSLSTIEEILELTGFKTVARFPQFYLMNTPVDSNSFFLKALWRLMQRFIKMGEWAGFIAGLVLYPLEIFLIATTQESPSSEIMICRKQR